MPKNKIVLVSLCVIGIIIFMGGVQTSWAESKIVKKTVKKVVLPPIAPVASPLTTVSQESTSLSTPTTTVISDNIDKIAATKKGLFGWGINADAGGFYMLNSGQQGLLGLLGGRFNFAFADPMNLGSKIGLAEDAVEYKVGLGLALGMDSSNNAMQTVPLFTDVVIYLPQASLYGTDPYVGLGLNFNILGTGGRSGGLGWQTYVGTLVDLGWWGEKTGFSIGYSNLRVSDALSAQGIQFGITQPLVI